jgi:5,10-methylenetetrahydrofolate reductase
MEEMTKIGTGFFLTTPVFDLEKFAKFMKQTNAFGVPVVAEVMILRTVGMARFLNRHLKPGFVPDQIIEKMAKIPDKFKASVDIFAEIVNGLKELCQGVHIITFGGEEKLKYYLDAAKIK